MQSWDAPDLPSRWWGEAVVRPQHPGWPQKPQAVSALAAKLDAELLAAAGSEPVVLFGFSQGAAMAIEVGQQTVGGVIGCSGYPHPDWSLTQAPQAQRS